MGQSMLSIFNFQTNKMHFLKFSTQCFPHNLAPRAKMNPFTRFPTINRALPSVRQIQTSRPSWKALENWKRPSISDLTVPKEPWQRVYDRNQKRYTGYLIAGILALGGSLGVFTNTVFMNAEPAFLKQIKIVTKTPESVIDDVVGGELVIEEAVDETTAVDEAAVVDETTAIEETTIAEGIEEAPQTGEAVKDLSVSEEVAETIPVAEKAAEEIPIAEDIPVVEEAIVNIQVAVEVEKETLVANECSVAEEEIEEIPGAEKAVEEKSVTEEVVEENSVAEEAVEEILPVAEKAVEETPVDEEITVVEEA